MLRKSLWMLLLLGFTVTTLAVGASKVLLVVDAPNDPILPEHFRTTSDPLPANANVNTKGLDKLHIAGGTQFSEKGLKKVKERVPRLTLVVDLRRESHGFIDGNAVSWYGPENSANCKINYDEIMKVEKGLLDSLKTVPSITVYQIIGKDDGKLTKTKPIVVKPQEVVDEETVVKRNRLYYMRLVVNDHFAPETEEVDDFINAVRRIPRGIWLYFHGRADSGRTTTFMVMYDIMRNAKDVSFEDILKRQKLLGGEDLENVSKMHDILQNEGAKQRLKFLMDFYQYARTNDDGFKTKWSDWTAQQKVKFEKGCYKVCDKNNC